MEAARLELPEPALPDAPLPQSELAYARVGDAFSSSSLPDAPEPQAQTQSAPPTDPSGGTSSQKPQTDAERKAATEAEAQRELHQRMAGIIPNFNAVLDNSNLPLTPKQKIRAAFHSAVDPYQFALAAVVSGFGQAEDSHRSHDAARGIDVGYSEGWVGYAQRYGASYADQFDGTIIGNGLLPILLHQDPRYHRKGTGTILKRVLYAASTAVICKGDNGKWQPNYSNVVGNIAAGGISNLYYPAHDRGFSLTIEQGFEVTAEGVFGSMLIEFYPDVRRHIHGKGGPLDLPPSMREPPQNNDK